METGAVHALAAAGLVNYWLLVAGVWCFTRIFSLRSLSQVIGQTNRPAARLAAGALSAAPCG